MSETPAALSEVRTPTIVAQRRDAVIPRKRKRAAFWRMLALVRPHRKAMIWGIVLGFGVALTYATSLVAIIPILKVIVEKKDLNSWLAEAAAHSAANGHWYAGQLAEFSRYFPPSTAPSAPMTTLLILLGVLLVVNLLGNTLRLFSQYLVGYASHRTMMDLRRMMFRKSLHIPMSAVSGDLSQTVNQFMSDVREIFMGITTLFGKVAREPLKAICVLAVAIFVDWKLTLAALAIAPPAVLLLWYFGRKVRKSATKLLEGYGRMLGGLEETLQGIAVVKGYAQAGQERRRMWRLERTMLKPQLKLVWIEAITSPLIEVVGLVVAAAGIVWLASRLFHQEISESVFQGMVILLAAMLDPIRKIANVYNLVQRSGAASDRVFRFLDQPEELNNRRPLRRVEAAPGDSAASTLGRPPLVQFQNVTFRYAPDAPPALDNVSLTVRPGECVAIVGPNGSGKSTLMRLLPRLLDVQDGAILVDDQEVRDVSLKSLREDIAIVDQRPVIFARTVRENIAYGHIRASVDEVRTAARRAYAAEFIERWPQQYETVMGEFGVSISGGQRQRISIARAFLKPSRVLIFDEATSEIDAESERKIHAALAELRQGRTTFLIAHRHTVMDMADRIVVMDGGAIVDTGTHAELIARCPLYVALYRSPTPH